MSYWTPSPIYFDLTGTLLSKKLFSVFLFAAGLSLRVRSFSPLPSHGRPRDEI
jgi:hypothetical protein